MKSIKGRIIKQVILGGVVALAIVVCALPLPNTIVLAAATDIAINDGKFPDPVFRAYINEHFDMDKDGMLSETEIAFARVLDLGELNISNLQGIEYLSALTLLYCSDNHLTTLDLSSNTALTLLFCDGNRLTSLDISKCSDLTALHCFANNLSTLNVSSNNKLEILRCSDNQLTTLDISTNSKLTLLDCSNNKLTALDVSKNPELTSLTCFGNQLEGETDIAGLNKSKTTELFLEPKPPRNIPTQPVPTTSVPTVSGPPQTALPTSATVLVNGKQINFDAYNINGNNFFKLRDIAMVMIGSAKQFEVGWNAEANAIALTSNQAYSPVGGEMASRGTENKQALPTTSRIYLDSVEVFFTAFNISGNNYFKLRDIGKTFNFGVDWDAATFTVIIDTSKPYIE